MRWRGICIGFGFLFLAINTISCKEIFEKSLDHEHIELSAPANNLVSNSLSQSFYWQPVDSGISYELQVVIPRFDSISLLVADTTIRRNFLTLSLAPAQYQWRVRAFNSSSTSPFSENWTLTIR